MRQTEKQTLQKRSISAGEMYPSPYDVGSIRKMGR